MAKESWKIVLACLIGAGLGTFTALEVNHYFWWVGLLVGGLAGYLSYEWRKVITAVPVAWKAAKGFTLPKDFGLRMIFGMIAEAGGTLSLVTLAAVINLLLSLILGEEMSFLPLGEFLMGLALIAFVGAVMGFPIAIIWSFAANDAYTPEAPPSFSTKERGLVALFSLPPVWFATIFFYLLPRYLWKRRQEILAWCKNTAVAFGRLAVRFGAFLKRFAWELFLRIHSEMRLLCGVDSFLGAGVGYFTGSVLVGAFFGAAFGLVNYLVVTKRWLEPRGYLPLAASN